MKGVRQADDPFVYFGAKLNKGLSLRSSTWLEVGKGILEGVGQRNWEEAVRDGKRRVAVGVDTGQQKRSVGMR